jgi:hypothetical protein
LNSWGIPIDEATSKDADRDNRKGTHYYEVEAPVDHAARAVEQWRKALGDDENSSSRVVRVRRVNRR